MQAASLTVRGAVEADLRGMLPITLPPVLLLAGGPSAFTLIFVDYLTSC
jgi:hypothetical protein